jgi:hypothetical protein
MRWGRALLNGLFLWFISLVIYLMPGLLYAFWLGAQLGLEARDYGALSQRMGYEISTIYRENLWLVVSLVVIIGVLILWRARRVAKGTWTMRWLNGLVVGAVPAVLSLLFALCGGLDQLNAITVVVYLAAGLVGGITADPT